jgi:hypothetical protein
MWKGICMPEDTTIVLFETNDRKIAEIMLEEIMKHHVDSDIAFALYNEGTIYPCIH